MERAASAGGSSKMAIPISQMWTVSTYVLKKKLTGNKRYPWC
jgi:hypothetical protein